MKTRVPLPIDRMLPEVVRLLGNAPSLVLQAAPGTGKTTRVPPTLLEATKGGEILVLEPRRLAAKLAARRVADELGEQVGKTVGYHFRYEKVTSSETRLTFLTEGMLVRRLLVDPSLKGVSIVILDEFHERHLHGDISLSHLRRLQKASRPDLRLVVMSATLDAEPVSKFLGDAPMLKIEGKAYDVETTYLAQPLAKNLALAVRDSVKRALELEDAGDILVFLPGMAEIRRAQSALEEAYSPKELLVAPLHGELSREGQDLAIGKAAIPKVILSTNVAETSLTIEGVRSVIDSGLHRIASYSWWSGVPALRTRPISRASAIQRAGRAGRQAPGRAFRLYTKGEYEGRAPFEVPEIRRADLAQTVLELKALGVRDLASYEWFEAPAETQVVSALELLFRLGALTSATLMSELTPLGRRLASIPAHPRIARVLIAAEGGPLLGDAATLAALIQESRLEGLDALAQLKSARNDESIRRARQQLLGALGSGGNASTPARDLGTCLLAGFPDRVGRLRKGELFLSSGGTARFEGHGRDGDFFVVLDLQEKQGLKQARSWLEVRSVCHLEESWLFDLEPPLVKEEERLDWDAERKRVLSVSALTCGAIVLSEDKKPPLDLERAARVLIKDGLGIPAERMGSLEPADLIRVLGPISDPEAIEGSLARMQLLHKHFPELGVPVLDSASLAALLVKLSEGKMSLEELEDSDPPQALIALLPEEAQSKIDRLLPLTVTLSGGRKPKVQYRLGLAPWIESRLQDFFGMKEGPSLLNGRLPLTLHLLAPNYRAVQVTTDLAGFWQRAYREVRRELSRNYPKHSWPENPLEAEPPRPRRP